MPDDLGKRMKKQYEFRARTFLPRRTYTILRLDGKAFHTYTEGLERPWDPQLMQDLADTGVFLCEQIQGTNFAYLQSDEISLLLTDFSKPTTEAWFDGNVQKMVSVAASLATARFNALRPGKLAFFDCRAFTIPDYTEVVNYFIWRQRDAIRNSVSMAAQRWFSPQELHGKSSLEQQEMLFQEKGIDWNSYPVRFRRGTVVQRYPVTQKVSYQRHGETVIEEIERWPLRALPAPRFGGMDEFFADNVSETGR
jgi:tRNA(His) 5'-end guanylyltransferase